MKEYLNNKISMFIQKKKKINVNLKALVGSKINSIRKQSNMS